MLEDSENKMVAAADIKSDEVSHAVTVTAVGPVMNRYHFPGVPDWKPMSVDAATYPQALAIWKQRRQPASTPEKVETATEHTNE